MSRPISRATYNTLHSTLHLSMSCCSAILFTPVFHEPGPPVGAVFHVTLAQLEKYTSLMQAFRELRRSANNVCVCVYSLLLPRGRVTTRQCGTLGSSYMVGDGLSVEGFSSGSANNVIRSRTPTTRFQSHKSIMAYDLSRPICNTIACSESPQSTRTHHTHRNSAKSSSRSTHRMLI